MIEACFSTKINLKDLSLTELKEWIIAQGLAPFRAKQIARWMYIKYSNDFSKMTDLSKEVRSLLKKKAYISSLKELQNEVSIDGTKKYLFELEDRETIETVLIPERDHRTLCISTQVGCAQGCLFCRTGQLGLKRNLKPSEIIDQIIEVKRLSPKDNITNLVFMGMGEPLANFNNVTKALSLILSQDGLGFSWRKVTVSTCGLVPKLKMLGKLFRVNIAVSLNATEDTTRNMLMPINRHYPIKVLIDTCKNYPLPKGRRITFEYVLIHDVNCSTKDANRLSKLISPRWAKINLIPFNEHPDLPFKAPTENEVENFKNIMIENNFTVTLRESKGIDIQAACGHLKSKY